MSWPMQPTGQWNPGIPFTPDMGLGSYTPEQWAAMQQNWQQWAQWQQQYVQWQNQYGEKYADQYQAMGTMPPLPASVTAPPPAPPPPEKPPPPPHENNQPLYAQPKPTPVLPPPSTQSGNCNTGTHDLTPQVTGINKNSQRSQTTNAKPEASTKQNLGHAEALKKLGEEERLFDIQFQKWEEEIIKWKKENVDHPDKQAYKGYEEKFEACRAQLLERRKQMDQKRAKLMSNNTPHVPSTTAGNILTAAPPLSINAVNFKPNVPPMGVDGQQNYSNQNHPQYQQYNMSQNAYNRSSNNINVELQHSYESSYNDFDDNYSQNSSFLPNNGSNKTIPGLDLVRDTENPRHLSNTHDVIEISREQENRRQTQAPDYLKISKGINNILGDEKIMNILSMVRGQHAGVPHPNANAQSGPSSDGSQNHNYQHQNQWNRQDNTFNNQQHNQQYANRSDNAYSNYNNQYNNNNRQNIPYNRQDHNPTIQQEQDGSTKHASRMFEDQTHISEEHFDNNAPYMNMPPRSGQVNVLSVPDLPSAANQHNVLNFTRNAGDNRVPQVTSMKPQPLKLKWGEEPLFEPSIIVEYEHKPLRLKARDFIEPVHMFDYNHISKEGENKKDFEKEVDDLFSRKPRRDVVEDVGYERYPRDQFLRDCVRRAPREDLRDDLRSRVHNRDDYEDKRRTDERRHDDRDRYGRREEMYRERDMRERDRERDRYRDYRRDDIRSHSKINEQEVRKRGRSKENNLSNNTDPKKARELAPTAYIPEAPKHVVMIDDILEPPGRDIRPEKIVVILRGPPGSGKSYLAKLIRDREAEHGGTARIMSIDDYFMQEGEIEEKDPTTKKVIKKPSLKYEYDETVEESYINSLKRAFRRTLTDGYFTFLIYDAVNCHLKNYADIWNYSRQCGFQVYVCTLEMDPQTCFKRNIHNRTLEDIQFIVNHFFTTPSHHIQLDPTTLLQSAAIPDVQMEDAEDEVVMEDAQDIEVESVFTSKWEKMDDAVMLARLDGTSKPLRPIDSMEAYLQLDEWTPNTAKPGKKTVRWADIEERTQQEKMRAIGFVVGQTDWNRMTDPTMGSSALTQTKYIERVRRTQ